MSKKSQKLKQQRPLLIGITGGIGAGKTLVAKIFELLQVPVFNADEMGKNILETHAGVREKVIEIFGKEAYRGNKPDRKFLASVVFTDDEMREKLNAIVHPAVGEAFQKWASLHSDKPYVLKEAAITFETGIHKDLDAVILVTAPQNLRIKRVMKRDGVSRMQVRKRMAAQWSDKEKLKLADYHIVNNEKKPVIPQVLKIHQELVNRAKN